MRESMAQLTPRFSTNRTVREYTEGHYLPAAAAYRARAADKGARGRDIVRWKEAMNEKWTALRVGEVKAQTRGEQHLLEVPVSLGDLDPAAVRVELYADGVAGKEPVRQEMKRTRSADGGFGPLRLQRHCVRAPPSSGLHRPGRAVVRRSRGPPRVQPHPLATLITSECVANEGTPTADQPSAARGTSLRHECGRDSPSA